MSRFASGPATPIRHEHASANPFSCPHPASTSTITGSPSFLIRTIACGRSPIARSRSASFRSSSWWQMLPRSPTLTAVSGCRTSAAPLLAPCPGQTCSPRQHAVAKGFGLFDRFMFGIHTLGGSGNWTNHSSGTENQSQDHRDDLYPSTPHSFTPYSPVPHLGSTAPPVPPFSNNPILTTGTSLNPWHIWVVCAVRPFQLPQERNGEPQGQTCRESRRLPHSNQRSY